MSQLSPPFPCIGDAQEAVYVIGGGIGGLAAAAGLHKVLLNIQNCSQCLGPACEGANTSLLDVYLTCMPSLHRSHLKHARRQASRSSYWSGVPH